MVGLINNWSDQGSEQLVNQAEPAWLSAKRKAALAQLQNLADPNRKHESWRYADANRLALQSASGTKTTPAEDVLEPLETALSHDVEITLSETGVHIDGALPAWLAVMPISEMAEDQWLDLDFDQETAVNLANSVLFNSGVYIRINDANQVAKIKLTYLFKDQHEWQYVRNHIEVSDAEHVVLCEQHHSGQINVVNVFNLGHSSQLQRQKNISLDDTDRFVSFTHFQMSSGVQLTNMNQHIGGLLQHHNQVVSFNAENSKFKSGSINKAINNNNISDLVNVKHHYKNNQSEVTHRSIAKDQSQIFNNAKALVSPGADQSEIAQDLKNILLSEEAKIFSKPELEVYADEVVAAHGSTIGALDEQSLFYLQSRGVAIEQAREIMIESFEQEAQVC